MVAVIGEAGVALRPETGKFASEAERDIDAKMPGIAGKAAGFFAAAFAVVGVGAFLGKAISEATDLGESASKVGVVFGSAAGQVEAFAATASSSLGITEAAALGATGTFGNLLRSTGLAEQAAADMSVGAVKLAGDLASFNNASPEEALDALRAGLVGEAEPLKRFGVNLNAAAIEAKAMELGLAGAGAELSDAAKATAAYAVIMEQTSLAQGDFGRTSDGLANQQRILKAQFGDLAADVGGLFVPALGDAAGGITGSLLPALLGATESLPALGIRFADSLGVAREAVANFGGIFAESMADGRAGAELLASEGMGGLAARAGVAAFSVGQSFSDAFGTLTTALAPILGGVLGSLQSAFGSIGEAIGGAFGGGGGGGFLASFAEAIGGLVETALPLIIDFVTRWAEVFQAAIPIIVTIVEALVPVISDLFAQLGPVIQQLVPIIGQVAGLFAGALLSVLTALAPVIPGLATAFAQIAQVLAGAFITVLQALIPILPPLLTAFAEIAVVLAGALAGALAAIVPIIPSLVGVLVQLIQSAIVPLLPMLPMLARLFAQIITALAPLIPPLLQLVAVIIQLVVAAVVPLLPLLPVVIGLFLSLMRALLPIIGVLLSIVGGFIGFASTVASVVLGLVSTVLAVWTRFQTGLADIVTRIVGGVTGGFRGLRDGVVGIFSGISDTVSGLFSGIGGAIRATINGVIRGINGSVIDGINVVIRAANVISPIDAPLVPRIPTLHSGGEFYSPTGEGLALLRSRELVVTPEQRLVADNLLRDLLDGTLPAGAATGAGGAAPITIEEHIHQAPGEPPAAVAARVTQDVVWKLNGGITRTVGAGAGAPA